MSDKLQELTDKLYNEGLSKGRAEGELLVRNAKADADKIISDAREKAAAIVAEAQINAENIASKADSDIKMASAQCLQATKKDIEEILVNSMCVEKIDRAMNDPDFIKEIIRTVIGNFNESDSKEFALMLPEAMKDKLESWVSTELSKEVNAGINAGFSKKISGGFTIGPKNGSWFISFTDETFRQLISEYLRPVTRKLLFGE